MMPIVAGFFDDDHVEDAEDQEDRDDADDGEEDDEKDFLVFDGGENLAAVFFPCFER